jgi:pimeloyl-ACP methyl ester carboxylesterase
VIDMPKIQVAQGTIEYRDEGSGPPVVFIHGALVNGKVWDQVLAELGGGARCIVPELPLGSHRLPMPEGADLTPPGIASMLSELLERLELEDATLVANDTGGAITQVLAANHPQRIGRLVLTNCDAFENFPPPSIRPAVRLMAHVPGAVGLVAMLGRLRAGRRAMMKTLPLTVEPLPDDLLSEWVSPLRDPGVRRDLVKVLRGMQSRYTREAAERLRTFTKPTLIVWGRRDVFFKIADAERLAALIPNARLEQIENARTFVQLDAPERLADRIAEFASAQATPA